MSCYNSVVSPKSWLVTLLLCLFVGVFGIHRFYAGKIGTGIIMILLCWTGISAIWALVDLIMIILSKFKDGQGLLTASGLFPLTSRATMKQSLLDPSA